MPFGELAWDHARRGLGPGASEGEIADAVAALLRRAGKGHEQDRKPALSKRDRRVAARTRAAALKEPQPAPPEPGSPQAEEDQAEAGEPLAKVIPMPMVNTSLCFVPQIQVSGHLPVRAWSWLRLPIRSAVTQTGGSGSVSVLPSAFRTCL